MDSQKAVVGVQGDRLAQRQGEGGQHMAAGQAGQHRLSGGDDELPENLRQGEGFLGVFGYAVGPGPQHHPGAGVEFAGVAQLGEHTVNAVGFLADVLQKEDFIAE